MTRCRLALIATNMSFMFRCETTALLTSSRSCSRSRSRLSCNCADSALLSCRTLSTATATWLATCVMNVKSDSLYLFASRLPNDIAPSRRSAVVIGTEQYERTPFSSSTETSRGKRGSSFRSPIISGCCVFITRPAGD